MKKMLDLASWERKDHYYFFRQFNEPFFGVTVRIDCSIAYTRSKSEGLSFFLYYLYQSLRAANQVEPFRYRIEGDDVFIHSQVHASPTINRPDGTFGFAYINYFEDLNAFMKEASEETSRVRESVGLIPAVSGENVIHYSSLPWIDFTSLAHARSFAFADSAPKISFGKMTESGGQRTMPMSVHVHHALMDGFHVAQYIDLFQQMMKG
ncbi:MAG: CatA-like O-acetyltransferase [Flavisolibacter sp.]